MVVDRKAMAKAILNVLSKQRFADWYTNGAFDDWLTGDAEHSPTLEQMLEFVEGQMFKQVFDLLPSEETVEQLYSSDGTVIQEKGADGRWKDCKYET